MNENIIVVKLGGSIFAEKDTSLADLAELYHQGKHLVVVHGGASKVSEWMEKLGIAVQMIDGERVTPPASLEVVTAVLSGLMNKEICAAFLDMQVKACGLSGVDGAITTGKARGGEMGLMGDVTQVNPLLLQTLLQQRFLLIISPVSFCAPADRVIDGQRLLNINGDPLAGALAVALKAEHLVFLTDTMGVKDNNGKILPSLIPQTANSLIEQKVAKGGMVPKLKAAVAASQNGVKVAIIDGRQPHALLRQLHGQNLGTIVEQGKANE